MKRISLQPSVSFWSSKARAFMNVGRWVSGRVVSCQRDPPVSDNHPRTYDNSTTATTKTVAVGHERARHRATNWRRAWTVEFCWGEALKNHLDIVESYKPPSLDTLSTLSACFLADSFWPNGPECPFKGAKRSDRLDGWRKEIFDEIAKTNTNSQSLYGTHQWQGQWTNVVFPRQPSGLVYQAAAIASGSVTSNGSRFPVKWTH